MSNRPRRRARWWRGLGGSVNFYKVGMELYAAAGMDFVRELLGQGKDVFLDLKFYDIPETVKRAVAQVARTGVRFLTVHAVGPVMRAAVEGRAASDLKLLAVTVLDELRPRGPGRAGLRLRSLRPGGAARAPGDGGRHGRHRRLTARSRGPAPDRGAEARSW